jgi:osmotically-inducible protein OsmY
MHKANFCHWCLFRTDGLRVGRFRHAGWRAERDHAGSEPVRFRRGFGDASSSSVADNELRQRVKTALHTGPYFYDEHVTVSVEKGDVVLRGFVSSDWDLRDAIRIASKAAGGRRVVDNLSIKLGGSR